MDWRSSVLIICFVIFTPYAWEYLVAFFSGMIPAAAISELIFGDTAEAINARVIVESVVYSLFACLIIAAPLGAIIIHTRLRTTILYAGLSTLHLIVVFLYERISTSTFYWPLAAVETVTFFLWLCVAMLAGNASRKFYRRFANAE